MINGIIFSLLIPFLGTTLGAAFVFLLHDKIAAKVQNTLLGLLRESWWQLQSGPCSYRQWI